MCVITGERTERNPRRNRKRDSRHRGRKGQKRQCIFKCVKADTLRLLKWRVSFLIFNVKLDKRENCNCEPKDSLSLRLHLQLCSHRRTPQWATSQSPRHHQWQKGQATFAKNLAKCSRHSDVGSTTAKQRDDVDATALNLEVRSKQTTWYVCISYRITNIKIHFIVNNLYCYLRPSTGLVRRRGVVSQGYLQI